VNSQLITICLLVERITLNRDLLCMTNAS